MNKALLLFRSTHDVIKAERLCRERGIAVQVIPVPRELSSECGMALEMTAAILSKAQRVIARAGIAVSLHEEAD
jgi:hypothetical protein